MIPIHEWRTVQIYAERINSELQRYEAEGWEVFQFFGTYVVNDDAIAHNVVLRRRVA